MNFSEIQEARRNPKHPAQIKTRKSNFGKLQPYLNMKDAYGSFTMIPKIGINPKQEWDTPIGIYTYPLRLYKEDVYQNGVRGAFPFASENPYLMILRPKVPILDISNLSESEFNAYTNKLRKMYSEYVSQDIFDFYVSEQMDSYGLRLWSLTKEIAILLAENKKRNMSVSWNTVFRSIGIKAIADVDGQGIIYENEPIQCVFLTKDSFELIDKIRLKYIKEDILAEPDIFLSIPKDDPKYYYYMYLVLLHSYGEIASDLLIEKIMIPEKVLWKLLSNDIQTLNVILEIYGLKNLKLTEKFILSWISELEKTRMLLNVIHQDKKLAIEMLDILTQMQSVDTNIIKAFAASDIQQVSQKAKTYLQGEK